MPRRGRLSPKYEGWSSVPRRSAFRHRIRSSEFLSKSWKHVRRVSAHVTACFFFKSLFGRTWRVTGVVREVSWTDVWADHGLGRFSSLQLQSLQVGFSLVLLIANTDWNIWLWVTWAFWLTKNEPIPDSSTKFCQPKPGLVEEVRFLTACESRFLSSLAAQGTKALIRTVSRAGEKSRMMTARTSDGLSLVCYAKLQGNISSWLLINFDLLWYCLSRGKPWIYLLWGPTHRSGQNNHLTVFHCVLLSFLH